MTTIKELQEKFEKHGVDPNRMMKDLSAFDNTSSFDKKRIKLIEEFLLDKELVEKKEIEDKPTPYSFKKPDFAEKSVEVEEEELALDPEEVEEIEPEQINRKFERPEPGNNKRNDKKSKKELEYEQHQENEKTKEKELELEKEAKKLVKELPKSFKNEEEFTTALYKSNAALRGVAVLGGMQITQVAQMDRFSADLDPYQGISLSQDANGSSAQLGADSMGKQEYRETLNEQEDVPLAEKYLGLDNPRTKEFVDQWNLIRAEELAYEEQLREEEQKKLNEKPRHSPFNLPKLVRG